MQNQVFISYRHESPEHSQGVRRLGELLRQAKIPIMLDQFFLEQHPGGPDTGWPQWCEDCANQSACVLIIASEGWFAAYEKSGPSGIGLGAATEADLFRQELWDEKGNNARIRVTFLHTVAADKIPVRLRAWHQFWPFQSNESLEQLVKWITNRLNLQGIELPSVQWPQPLEFQPDLADRNKKEWPAVVDLLAGRSRERILIFEGGSGLGKSELLRQTSAYAQKLGLPVAQIDFKGGVLKIEDVLGIIDLELGAHLPNFSRDGANKSHMLRKDLRGLRQPVLLIFDSYEAGAANQFIADWLSQQLLTEVGTALGLAVIISGQKAPDFANAGWRELARHLPLTPITEIEHWQVWVSRRYPAFHDKGDLLTLLKLAEGNPSAMAHFCALIAKS
ncbi:MAG TPA: SEFIR domain-containing protein [Candidatus Angelobacter sp.]|jgi:hypothetical protein|nr:SEFIR domain-containing protein [Candidatus Angelobacter sp.]